MPKVSKQDANTTTTVRWSPGTTRSTEKRSVRTFKQDIDATLLLKGPPDVSVIALTGSRAEREARPSPSMATSRSQPRGHAFYVPPGHLQRAESGTEYSSSAAEGDGRGRTTDDGEHAG